MTTEELIAHDIKDAEEQLAHGLEHYLTNESRREFNPLGVAELEHGGAIEVEVACLPSRFYRLTVRPTEGGDVVLTTGSGRLRDFMPTAVLFAEGMIGVEKSDEPLDEPLDPERYVIELGLGPGYRRDIQTGAAVYSAAWLEEEREALEGVRTYRRDDL